MKKIIYTAAVFAALTVSSCGNTEVTTEGAPSEISKEIKAEIINGETTVTVTTTENGKETVKKLTGIEAETYLAENKLEEGDHPEGAEVIVKTINTSKSTEIDTDEILNDPELDGLDAATKEKVKKALENALKDSEMHMESEGDQKIKTKIIISDEKGHS